MLELKNVSSGYGKKQVLNNVSLKINKGELLCLIGPNGCGKSTMLKTSVGLLKLTSGEVSVDGRKINFSDRKSVARVISCLHQSRTVPDMIVEQMVLHGRFPHISYPRRYSGKDKEIALAAISDMEISDLSAERLSDLSGGNRQKAYIAMALCQDTEYILLDEPATGLDTANRYMLMGVLRKLTEKGKAVVCVLHDLPLVFEYSDKIAVMDKGELLFIGTPEELYNSDIIKKVFRVELKRTDTENGYKYYCLEL